MASRQDDPKGKRPKKVRVAFRRNRQKPARIKDWAKRAAEAEGQEIDTQASEGVVAKGALSRHRTIIEHDADAASDAKLRDGVVVAMRGLYADVDDGQRVWSCTVRRVLRTRSIHDRHPVTVGDKVRFRVDDSGDDAEKTGTIEHVHTRHGELRRKSGKRVQTIVANVDQVVIVGSASEPRPKPNLIDRYIVAALSREITPIICINKVDLDPEEHIAPLASRYRTIGHRVILASVVTGVGIEELRQVLAGRESVIAGQSGVGKSSLLNAVQPGLSLRIGLVAAQTGKGRHTTTTARLLRLDVGGFVVDTPGIRSFDLTVVPRNEFEAYFVEFVRHVRDCRFPDCTHTHETDCAVKAGVERGDISEERYRSYVQIFEDPGTLR